MRGSSFVVAGYVAAGWLLLGAQSFAAELPNGYWGADKTDPILEKTVTLRLAPDLSALTRNEQIAVRELVAAGKLMHSLYLQQSHHQAIAGLANLHKLHTNQVAPAQVKKLASLYRIFNGPIATTLENERIPFVPVDAPVPGKNLYPRDATARQIDAAVTPGPTGDLLGDRTVVRTASRSNLAKDLDTLRRYPALDTLHPGLTDGLKAVNPSAAAFYSVPYSLAYADHLMKVYRHLRDAAAVMQDEDRDFSAYLQNRARDLLANDYEAGDASWVTGNFERLNAQIGSYETYDDELLGTKTFFSLSVLAKDEARSKAVADAIGDIQAIENSLPYERHKRVRANIPVGVYNVIADFGQARGTNTASILPNDANHSRKYGRTILLRANIMLNEELFRDTQAAWAAAVAPAHVDELTLEGGFQRTLWHEIGHYLGVATDERGRSLDLALKEYSDLLEEMKADLVSLHSAPALRKEGYYTDAAVRALYADGIRRTLQKVKPRRDQPYQTMQLMQMNYFLENRLLSFDVSTGKLNIHYKNYHGVVRDLLREVLAIQSAGDAQRAAEFVDRYTTWNDELHGVLGKNMRNAAQYRYRLVRYEALGE